ncbi:hypothetical protein [Streptomyces cinereoruber]|uniref:hypothetical protein n=1 Tax=Streptomyces cinereoruber TaxID=67260 RepID=UPI0036987C7C
MTHTLTKNRWRKLAFACAVSALAVGCTTNEPASQKPPSAPPSSTAPAATPSKTELPPDPAESTKKEVITLYQSYWKEMEKAYALGNTKETRLSQYAAGLALAQAEKNVTTHSAAGRTTTGSVEVANPTVTKLNSTAKLPRATLSTCLDISRWNLVDKATKQKVQLPSGRLTRYVTTTTVEKWPQGWKVVLDEPQEQAC